MSKLKTKKQLLAAFKRANKVRRLFIANRAGFDSVEGYLSHLNTGIENDKSEETKKVIHNVHILDTSASMGSLDGKRYGEKLKNAISGIKSEWLELSLDDQVEYKNSLVTFHDKVHTEFWRLGFLDIPSEPVTNHWGSTALYTAVCQTLLKLIKQNTSEERVLVKIFTDGAENCSRGYASEDCSRLINQAKRLGITITFVGTSRDVQHTQYKLGVDGSNTLVHDNTAKGVLDTFFASTQSTRGYATKVAAGATKEETLKGFFKQEGTL